MIRAIFRRNLLGLIFSTIAAAAGCCHHPSPVTPAASARATAAPFTRPYITRPKLAMGDWVRITVVGLPNSDGPVVSYGRVSIRGTVRFPRLDRREVAGLTPHGAALAAADLYGPDKAGNGVKVSVDVVSFQQPGDPLPRVIQPFDLVRVDIDQLTSVGMIRRVSADGTVDLPLVGDVKISGADEEGAANVISKPFSEGSMRRASVEVTILEQAPPNAEHLDLPDGPAYPVSELIKPLFDPSKSLDVPGPAGSALSASTSTVQIDRSGVPPLARASAHPGTIRPGDWLRVDGGLSFVRVTADGNVAFPYLKPIHAAGMTPRVLEQNADKAYETESGAGRVRFVEVDWIFLQQPGASLPRPIAPLDLVRIDQYGPAEPYNKTTVIKRVGSDGTVNLPSIGAVIITGMADDAATMAVRNKLGPNMSAVVTTIEQAPPDAGQRSLPAGPVLPVPDPLVPLFSP